MPITISIIGLGATGTLYGAIAARGGARVQCYGRGEHLRTLKSHPAVIESAEFGTFRQELEVTDDVKELSTASVVLVALPLHQVDGAGPAIRAAVGPASTIVPLCNGVDSRSRLDQLVSAQCTLWSTTIVQCEVSEPGTVVHKNLRHKITVGGEDSDVTARQLRSVGLSVSATADGRAEVWRMAAFRVPLTVACCGLRASVGVVKKDKNLWELVKRTSAELVSAARSSGIKVSRSGVEFALLRAPSAMIPSSARDVISGVPVGSTELPVILAGIRAELDLPLPIMNQLLQEVGVLGC